MTVHSTLVDQLLSLLIVVLTSRYFGEVDVVHLGPTGLARRQILPRVKETLFEGGASVTLTTELRRVVKDSTILLPLLRRRHVETLREDSNVSAHQLALSCILAVHCT